MFILTVEGRETEGAYSVQSDDGEQVLYLFEDEDDAIRYALLLEDQDYWQLQLQVCVAKRWNLAVVSGTPF